MRNMILFLIVVAIAIAAFTYFYAMEGKLTQTPNTTPVTTAPATPAAPAKSN